MPSRYSRLSAMCRALVLLLLPVATLAAAPLISEFVASNGSGLQDEDGDFPDWVEIHNPDATPLDLSGWHLTDNANNKVKWRFPATVVPPGGYLVVFASNKNRRVPGAPLHTNFALSVDGEYLGLIAADGLAVVHEYAPAFPPQLRDYSYGIPGNIEPVELVAPAALARWVVPASSTNPPATWRNPGFNDAGWNAATLGIGYDRNLSGVNFLPEIGAGGNTESAMFNIRQSCYLRVPFSVADPAALVALTLRVKYDDGFAAYLNGQPLLAGGVHLVRNAPSPLAWNSGATRTNEDLDAVSWADFEAGSSLGLLQPGANVLAIQALNRGLTSSDLLLRVNLLGESASSGGPQAAGYFAAPTPGARNGGPGSLVIPQEVTFSRAEGTFINPFNLALGGAISGQEIRYTLDGSLPTPASPLYTGPLGITATVWVRARLFEPATGAAGFPGGAHYEKLAADLASYGGTGQPFRSALPLVVLNNRGGGEIPNDDIYRDTRIHFIERGGDGYAALAAAPQASSAAGAKLRGSSSAGFPKKSYNIELRAEAGDERALALAGMPAGSDWALISCYNFDRSFMRNAWIYEMARRAGRWAPRTRLVEVFFNQDGNDLSYADYRGVYVLCESIRGGGRRVDLTGLEPADTVPPQLSGGYIFKLDRQDPDEFAWRTTRGLPPAGTATAGLVIHRPKLPDLAPQQSAYLVGYFQQFEDALFADAAANFSSRGYRSFIDPESWVEHNILNAIAKNVDALRLSAFLVKDRGRPIEGGPLWDFDRSVNSTDSRDDDPYSWRGTGDATDYFAYAWWQQLFQDVEFRQLFVDRWQALRRGPLATTGIHALLDGYLAEFKPADADNPARRDYARWYGSPTANNITTETNLMKSWLANRAAWIDSQFTPAPAIALPPGPIAPGQTTTLSVPSGTTVYYTLDGSDPRAEGGGWAPGVVAYTGNPVVLNATSVLTARAWRPGVFATPATNWSGPASALHLVGEAYASAAGGLRVSEIHCAPLGPDAAELAVLPDLDASDFEWLELANTGTGAVNLDGVGLVAGAPVSEVVLPPFTLAPGERALVVKNRAAFLLRHPGAAGRVVAEWRGDKKLDNSGEEIHLRDRSGADLARFTYATGGAWPARARGEGSSLEYLGTGAAASDYENPANWRASAEVHGSPGAAGSGPPARIAINELLARAEWPQVDALELLNRSSAAVDLSGWFLGAAAAPLTEADFRKFRIPDGTVLDPGAYLVFTAADFNPNGAWNPAPGQPAETEFELDGYRGGRVWLVSAGPVAGSLGRFEDEVAFTPAATGTTQGRWPDGTGAFRPLAAATLLDDDSPALPAPGLGAANAGPRTGPLQVSEIMYHPAAGQPEFIQLTNCGAAPAALDGWTLRGDVDFYFGPAHNLAAGESLLLAAFDPLLDPAAAAALGATYGLAPGIQLAGPWSAGNSLGDAAGNVRLRRALPPPPEDPTLVGLMLEDEVPYAAAAPWPAGAAGTGWSIRRLGIQRFGADPAAWIAGPPAPGREAGGYPGWQRERFGPGAPLAGPLDDPDADGTANALEYRLGTDPLAAAPLPPGLLAPAPPPGFALELWYWLRRDRDDVPVNAWQSPDLHEWQRAWIDETVRTDGLWEHRRARLPAGPPAGFLQLRSP
jgi:hypothetical protein